ncbi:unnamed protein product [Mytilus edulis]|uniref:Integrase catalytic domain-containing protein n=1 Tax=Mytilus edulis TaxID=6550 RepID=A0A8S3PYL7_MYTED|nr:unnamed protein product [Mytilus edulis]
MNQKANTGKLTRWAMDLQHYNFEIKYRKGCNNQVADALSRHSYPEQPDDENVAAVKVSEVNTRTEASGNDKTSESIEVEFFYDDYAMRINRDTKGKKPPLNPLPVDTTFERWHMDFLKLSKTNEGYSYVLLLVDSFSKWSEAFPMKTQEASEVAKVLFREIISRYGAMKCLVTDLGRNFVSNLVNALCEMLNITRHHTSSYHPQTNGLVERTNSTLIQAVRAYSDKDQNN